MTRQELLILDTNVVISAQLSPHGPPGVIWNMVLARRVGLAYDDRIIHEYEEVLSRPKFKFPEVVVKQVLLAMLVQQHVVALPWKHQPLPDPDDVMFLEVAEASGGILVTGNVKHYPEDKRGNVLVLTPVEWLERYIQGANS